MHDSAPDLRLLDRQLGDVLFEGEIARSSRAVIYRVRTGGGDRPLALKVALTRSDAEDLARFRHEVRLLSEARHPNVVEVFDFGILPGDFPFLTMELLESGTLPARAGRLDWRSLYDLAQQAAAGLAHIHRQGVVHLDIKPHNLGLTEVNGRLRLKILDFGLAQSVSGPLDLRIRGTLAYTAPEILLQDRYDHRADLYSLGMTLFELATGILPSAGDELAAVRFHLEGELPEPLSLRPDMPADFARVLLRLLRRDPADRYPSAGRLLADLAQSSGSPSEAVAVASSERTMLASRLIGRDDVLGRLRSALAAATEGQGGALLIEGEDGVGKSRLLREFRLLAAVEGVRVGRSRDVSERSRPLEPFLEAMAAVGVEVPSCASSPAGESAQREQFRLFRQTALALAAHAQKGPPVLLLLDDFHLAGRQSEDLLAYLATELRSSRILIVAARRPVAEAAMDLESLPVLQLASFDARDTIHLIDACLGSSGLLPDFYAWVHRRSRGVPGEIQRLLRHLIDDRALLYRDGEWKPSLAAILPHAALPADAEKEELQRIAALSPPLRETLEATAVVAGPFSLLTLAALLNEDPQSVYERTCELVERGHLEPLQEAEGSFYNIPRSQVRQALYTAMDTDRRALLHRRLGALLEQGSDGGADGPAAVIAEHFWRGGARGRSLPYLLRAAAAAKAVYGYSEAANFYGRSAAAAMESGNTDAVAEALAAEVEALTLAGLFSRALRVCHDLLTRIDLEPRRSQDPAFLARTLLSKGRLHSRLGEHEAALESHGDGLRAVDGLGETELEVELLAGRALALRDLGEWDAAFAAARSALARAGRGRLRSQRAKLLNTLGMFAFGRGDWKRAGRLVRRGLWVAEAHGGDEALCLTLRNNLGNILWKTGDFDGALALYSRNLELCERTHDVWGQLSTLNNLGILECSRGNWKAAREPLTRSLELKRRLGLREREALARLNLGEVEEVLGNWTRAQRHYERSLRLLENQTHNSERLAALAQLASLDRKRGRSTDAERRAREALAGAERTGDRDLLAQCYHLLGQIEKDRDNLEMAGAHLEKALEIEKAAGTHQVLARIQISLADLALRNGDQERATRHASEARRWIEVQGDRFTLAKLFSVEARLASAKDEVEDAERLFAEGVRLLEELEAPYEHARSLYEWGLRTWNVETALRRLRRALVGFERLGADTESKRTSGAIERVREHQRITGGRGISSVLYEVVKVVNSSLDLQQVLNRAMDLILARLGAERGMIVLTNRLTRELEVAVSRNLGREDEDEGRELSESVVRRVFETREPVLTVDALTDGRFAGAASIVARHILSILCVPLAIRDRLAGAIYVDHRQSRHLFGQADLEFLVAFADQAAIAIENARLYGELEAARQSLKEENESLRREILSGHRLASLIGKSRSIAELKQMLEKLAQSPSTVLIRGESGTGKGLVARIIHSISPRRQAPFIHFNCAALPETLVESELFGHEKGAFTGAAGQKPGRFELANHGTIFLDEVGKISRSVQAKLLRVVEEKEFERVGGTRTLRSDVRVIAATNLDLEIAIARNEFREDLYYRLNIVPILLQPLRERREDIPYLLDHFLTKISRDLGRAPKELDPAVLELFFAYDWPGNVRELEAAIHRAFVLAEKDTLTVEDFGWIALAVQGAQAAFRRPAEMAGMSPVVTLSQGSYEAALQGYDRQLIAAALVQSKGKIREAARLLGIARNTLRAKMKKYGLQAAED